MKKKKRVVEVTLMNGSKIKHSVAGVTVDQALHSAQAAFPSGILFQVSTK